MNYVINDLNDEKFVGTFHEKLFYKNNSREV